MFSAHTIENGEKEPDFFNKKKTEFMNLKVYALSDFSGLIPAKLF